RPTGRGADAAGQVAVAGAVDGVGDGVRRLRGGRDLREVGRDRPGGGLGSGSRSGSGCGPDPG
ncbi:hypothetical protein, partial [Streptomyces sp. NPDC059515]|uniref:hypothetical protein n=1 Tax=Streptomyces sp. NPDC059515 TaxID=3346854 RepID=UPI00369676FC